MLSQTHSDQRVLQIVVTAEIHSGSCHIMPNVAWYFINLRGAGSAYFGNNVLPGYIHLMCCSRSIALISYLIAIEPDRTLSPERYIYQLADFINSTARR